MDEVVKARYNRERLAINGQDIQRAQTHHGHVTVTPALTTSPQIDSLLADAGYIAKRFLEKMRDNLDQGNDDYFPDPKDRKEFREICKTIHSQARVQMDLEKHQRSVQDNWNKDKLRDLISTALQKAQVDPSVTNVVLNALKLLPRTNEYESQA